MSDVLKDILSSNTVSDGLHTYPLKDNMDEEEGRLITEMFREARPSESVEVGCAYGISALFACDAMREAGHAYHHTIIDPHQSTDWRGIGLKNLREAGHERHVHLIEEPFEIALPRLLSEGRRIQAAIIDGWHTFDHTLIDFFYVNKMLDVGGVVIIDDTHWPGIMPVVDHIATYPAYELVSRLQVSDVGMPGRIRRGLRNRVLMPGLRRPWDYPSCVAFRKIAEDKRNYDWHADF